MNKKSNNKKNLALVYRPLNIFDVWDNLSREMWDSWRPLNFGETLMPETKMFEQEGHLVMKTELPGISKKDLDITLSGDRLTIKAEKKEKTVKGVSGKDREHYIEQYYHSVTLPYPIKEDGVTAKLDKGILELRLPKGEEVKPKKIEIKGQLQKSESKKLEPKPN